MNKKEWVSAISEKTGLNLTQSDQAASAVFEVIASALKNNESITIPGFGSFSAKVRVARIGRNPRTGEAMEIPESTIAAFKASAALKTLLNEQ